MEEAEASAPVVLGVSRFRSEEALAKVRGLVADAFNEGGATDIRVGSDAASLHSCIDGGVSGGSPRIGSRC